MINYARKWLPPISAPAHVSFRALPPLRNPLKHRFLSIFQSIFKGGQGPEACMSPCTIGVINLIITSSHRIFIDFILVKRFLIAL